MDTGHDHHDHSQHQYNHNDDTHDAHQEHMNPILHTQVGGHQHGVDHQAFFNTRFNVTVLFSQWALNNRADVFIACVVTCVLAAGYQGTKWLRQYLHQNFGEKRHSIKSKEHLLQTILYVMEFLTSYVLMLVVMTYNVWVFVVTIIGLGIGYFLIGWHKSPRGPSSCAESCPTNQYSAAVRAKSYEKTPPDQELLPLDNGATEACGKGCCEADIENIKETDILT